MPKLSVTISLVILVTLTLLGQSSSLIVRNIFNVYSKDSMEDDHIKTKSSLNLELFRKAVVIPCLSTFLFWSASALAVDDLPLEPSITDIQTVQMAFRDFDSKRFIDADKEFSTAISQWKLLHRPRDEIVSLLKARANVRLDNKHFTDALADYNEAIDLMSPDGQKTDGTASYPEYPDTYVGRALANEGLADWNAALKDYDNAIVLWGGGRGENVNPYVLTFRGNTLCKLNRCQEAIPDYEASSDRFNNLRDVARYSDAKANLALALYSEGRRDEAVKAMKDVIRKNPGYADMHVAVAADAWGRGDYITALNEWRFACDQIDVGCEVYKDDNWISTVRRWPTPLVEQLRMFRAREIPPALRGTSGAVLAPQRPSK